MLVACEFCAYAGQEEKWRKTRDDIKSEKTVKRVRTLQVMCST